MKTLTYSFHKEELKSKFISTISDVGITYSVKDNTVSCTFKYKTIEILTTAYYNELIK